MASSTVVAAVVIGALGAGTAGVLAARWLKMAINHRVFVDVIVKLCSSGDLERARRLCEVAPWSPVARAVARCLASPRRGAAEPESETIERLREIYVTTLRAHLTQAARTGWLAAVALGCAALVVYLVVGEGAPPWTLAPAAAAGLGVLFAWRQANRIAREGALESERLLPAMASAHRGA